MAVVLSARLRPATSGINLTSRPGSLPPSRQLKSLRTSGGEPATVRIKDHKSPSQTTDAHLSVMEVEHLLKEHVQSKISDLQQAFKNYDADQRCSVTKGQFRHVLESHCFPMTSDQFEAVASKVVQPNGTICYTDFLNKFYGHGRPSESVDILSLSDKPHWTSFPEVPQRKNDNNAQNSVSLEALENTIREKINQNLKNVVKGLRLYDYNRDGFVQKQDLRKVLENYCLKMTDQQYEKLYQRYDFQRRGIINYKEFFTRLGISVDKQDKTAPSKTASGVLSWQEFQQQKLNQQQKKLIRKSESDTIAGMSMDQIEILFRKKMSENYVNLKRMFIAFDPHLQGFVMLEDLRSILCQFTVPLSEPIFVQLMDRFNIKASGKVSWEFFLEKFQDPQSHGNGQTVPIKPCHKFFPIRGVQENVETVDALKLLYDHVKNNYSSYKQAFLEIDKNRNGYISRKELRKLMDTFQFELSNAKLKELMTLLDPQNTNSISYQRFLNLFEERETKEGHKWLNSVHRFNDRKPAVLPWESLEEILREKIQENWNDIAAVFVSYDQQRSGFIQPKDLRRMLERFVLPLSDDHFQHLLSRLDNWDGGKINYVDFLTKLGVSVKPGDMQGLSTQIHDESVSREQERLKEQENMGVAINRRILGHTDSMSPEQILARIKDHMSQHSTHIRQAFQNYDIRAKGKVSRKDFRKVLGGFGMTLSDEAFKALCAGLNFTKGHMLYSDFISNFEDLRSRGPSEQLHKTNNHCVNPIRGDENGLTMEQIKNKLCSKLGENFENLRRAFYKFDDDHNGILNKSNFRHMLDSFMCITTDAEFEKLCQHLGIDKNSRISYSEFLDRFEIRDTKEGHKWLNSDHRFNSVLPAKPMTAECVHEVLVEKAHQHYKDMAAAFLSVDSSGNGFITKNELRDTLYKFVLPINNEEFGKLWQRYDVDAKGHVNYKDFLKRLTAEQFAPGDQDGISKKIIDNSHEALEQHHQGQQELHKQITQKQAQHSLAITTDQLVTQLKDRIRDQFSDFHEAFKKYDKKQRGYLTVADIQKILLDFNYFLDDDQFYDFLQRLQLKQPKMKLTYEGFRKVFEEGRIESYSAKPQDAKYPTLVHDHLTPEVAERKMKELIAAQADVVQSACQAFDRSLTFSISMTHFRRVLDNFCFKMTDKQFKHLMSRLDLQEDGKLNYLVFLLQLKPPTKAPEEDAENFFTNPEKWIQKIEQHCEDSEQQERSMEDIQKHISQYVKANYFSISSALSEADYANMGVITKEDFRNVLYKHTISLSEEQFEKFWKILPVNEFGNLDYHAFLRQYSSEDCVESQRGAPGTACLPRTAVSSLSSRPTTCFTEFGRNKTLLSRISGEFRPFTPMVNAETIETKLKYIICGQWKDIQRLFRLYDPEDTGEVKASEFKAVLGHFNINLQPNDRETLLTKYDVKNNGLFCYRDFLRHFVLTVGPQRKPIASVLNRNKQGGSQGHNSSTVDANDRLKACVLNNWKDMRRLFRSMDRQGTGQVGHLDFRLVLKNFSINLSEEEFQQFACSYDRNNDGNISYNDFLGAFLRNG